MKMQAMYVDRGLPEVCVDSEQIKALHKENNSERQAYQDLQKGFNLLQQQFAQTEDLRRAQEQQITLQSQQLESMRKSREKQFAEQENAHKVQITALKKQFTAEKNELEQLRKSHENENAKLREENRKLKENHAAIIASRDSVQNEMLKQSDYILSVQEKYYQASKQLIHLLDHLKDQEKEIEELKKSNIKIDGLSVDALSWEEASRDYQRGTYYSTKMSPMNGSVPSTQEIAKQSEKTDAIPA